MADFYGGPGPLNTRAIPYPPDPESSPGAPYNQRYVLLSENGEPCRPPPYRRNVPRYYSLNKKRRCGCCCKCICFLCCFLFLAIIATAATLYVLYTHLKPQVPSYNVQDFQVSEFDIDPNDFSLNTVFNVILKAQNPNTRIAIFYEKGSLVDVNYQGNVLCAGKLPVFRQGHENTTVMNIELTGKSAFGTGLQAALMEQQHTGRVPLLIHLKVPVALELEVFAGQFMKMRQVTVLVNASLIVDNLSPKKKIGIKSIKYTFGAELS